MYSRRHVNRLLRKNAEIHVNRILHESRMELLKFNSEVMQGNEITIPATTATTELDLPLDKSSIDYFQNLNRVRAHQESTRRQNSSEEMTSLFSNDNEVNDYIGDIESNYDHFVTSAEEKKNIKCNLASWAQTSKCSKKHVNDLLHVLKPHIRNLPSDSRTLCKTPKATRVKKTECDGATCSYRYIGIEANLKLFLTKYSNHSDDIQLDFNIDGIGMSNSSSSDLWPILMSVVGSKEVYMVALHHFKKKPNMNEYLKEFVEELIYICEFGLAHQEKLYKVQLRCFICDAPARASVLNIKSHTGYFCCHRCKIMGKHVANRRVFTGINFEQRTGDEFKLKIDENHHHGRTEIDELEIDAPKLFVLDYMHAVLLGVMKQLLTLWIIDRGNEYSISREGIKTLSTMNVNLCSHYPSDFSRRPRSFDEISRFKATELRSLLLYTLPILLKTVLRDKCYIHFLKFHCAIRILCCPNECINNAECANDLLRSFVNDFPSLYGDINATYNVHCLLHITDDVKNFNTNLNDLSAFKFENFLQTVKTTPKHKHRIVEQIINRISEKNTVEMFSVSSQNTMPEVKTKNNLIVELCINNTCFSIKSPNNYCLINNLNLPTIFRIEKILNISDKYIIFGRPVKNLLPIYDYPLDSRIIHMFKVNGKEQEIFEDVQINVNVSKISKLFHLVIDIHYHYFIKMIHS